MRLQQTEEARGEPDERCDCAQIARKMPLGTAVRFSSNKEIRQVRVTFSNHRAAARDPTSESYSTGGFAAFGCSAALKLAGD